MNFDEYLQHDATALAECVARGEVAPAELLELALARQQAVRGRINALSRLMEGEARGLIAGGLPEGPFRGVPFLLKDGVHDWAGLPTSYGCRGMLRLVPAEHAYVVRRYLRMGLVVFGKTNLPELALKAVSDSALHGRACNPWDLGRTPGGSSGGAAAAVTAGIVPMAAGNDGGGSIRIPAACCGLVGLRPSRGRVSVGPGIGEVWYGASTEGVLSRSVRDTARALDALQGAEPGDPFVIAPPAEPCAQAWQRPPGRLRIGWTTRSPIGTPVHPEAVAAVHDAVALLASLGHEPVEAEPAIDGDALARSYLHLYFGQVPALVGRARAAGAGNGDFEPLTRVLETLGRAVSAGQLTQELWQWNGFGRALADFHARHDLLLTPTLAEPPIRHGQGDPPAWQQTLLDGLNRSGLLGALARRGWLDGMVNQIARDNLQAVPFTQLANLTGVPAISLPLYWTPEGLPLGVQFVAPFGREDRLLQLAGQLEQARPWAGRRPPL